MTDRSTVQTAHGAVDASALEAAQGTYDTELLLRSVDKIDEVVRQLTGEDGLRDQLLQLHAMASTVINGAGIAGPPNASLPEAAADIVVDLQDVIGVLRGVIERAVPLAALAPNE